MGLKRIFEDWRYAFGWITAAVIIVALLLSAYLVVATKNAAKNNFYVNSISITGHGEVKSTPDIATFDFSVTEVSETVDSAQKVATEKINKALQFLRDNGVEDKDLKNSGYNIYPRYEWIQAPCSYDYCPNGNNTLVGYEVNQSVTVKVRDTSQAGKLLTGIGAVGISNVSGLSFTTDDPDALKDQAKKLAIEDAKKQAKELAKNLGVRIGKVISFSEDTGYYGGCGDYGCGYGGEMLKADGTAASPEIPSGEQTINATVYVGYEIK